MLKKIFLAGVGLLASGILLTMASPALAATTEPTLPSGDKFFAVSCTFNGGDPSVWSVLTTGAATKLGSDTSVSCAYGGAYDSLADKYYFLNIKTGTWLASFDPTTGEVTDIAEVNGAASNPNQLIIDDASHAYIISDSNFYSINLSTATTTLIGAIGDDSAVAAYNPVDHLIYGFGYTLGSISTINPATGEGTIIHSGVTYTTTTCPDINAGDTGNHPNGVAFDSNGIAWMQMDNGCDSDIEAWNPLTNESWSTGFLYDATHLRYAIAPYDFFSMTYIVGRSVSVATAEPALAVTGSNSTNMGLLAGGATLAALLGAGAVLATRRRTARN